MYLEEIRLRVRIMSGVKIRLKVSKLEYQKSETDYSIHKSCSHIPDKLYQNNSLHIILLPKTIDMQEKF